MIAFFQTEVFRFAVVGVVSTIVNYVVNFVFIYYNYSAHLASGVGYLSGVLVGFPLNKLWSFQAEKKFNLMEFLKYMGLYVITLGVNIILSGLSYDLFNDRFTDPMLAKIWYYLPVIVITTVLNFIGCKLLVFKGVSPRA